MRVNWDLIKFVIEGGLVVFLYSFTKQRNQARNLTKIEIDFLDDNPPFITRNTVNKLLIQNNDSVTSIGKETLVLNEMESRLLENPMIRDAEVFITVDGVLGATIEQRKPIARVAASPNYYLDADGKKMPLSSVYTARVPLITAASTLQFDRITPMLLKLHEDEFMKSSVIGLHVKRDGNIVLRLRKHDLKVFFGKPSAIDKKFQNFKAFYKKTKMDKMLSEYASVNLEFGNQVVATKK